MNNDMKWMMTLIFTILVSLMGCIGILGYMYGVSKGELNKMEAFKDIYVPNPSNVYPDAVDSLGGE